MKMDKKSLAWIGIGGIVTSIIGYVAVRQQLKWMKEQAEINTIPYPCLLYTSPSPRDATLSRMPSSA